MAFKIQVLKNELINKIAAGEVIERPASIVKELVENSIDAAATNITIEIKNGGINYIKITDNGAGIKKDEVKTAFLRHATSKLDSFEQLNSILTLGFRGEALSSIAAISQVEMLTKNKDEEIGTKLSIEAGEIVGEEECQIPCGTTFIIKNVFYNTPVRKKFLKKESVESGYISDIINRFALGNPEISFKYINNGSVVLETVGSEDLKTTVFYVYGKDVANKMIPVSGSQDGFILNGLIGSPQLSRGNRTYSNIFINGRYIKSKLIQDAIEQAFDGKLMIGKFPVYVINLITPCNTVDVNVHPTKMEIKFENEDFIAEFIHKTVKKALKSNESIAEFNFKELPKLSEVTENKPYDAKKQEELEEMLLNGIELKGGLDYNSDAFKNICVVRKEAKESRLNKERDKELQKANARELLIDKIYPPKRDEEELENAQLLAKNEELSEKELEQKSGENAGEQGTNAQTEQRNSETENIKKIFNSYKIVGQFFNTYWIVEKNDNIYMIDQHALHEKYLYEKLIKSVKEEKIISQPMLEPATFKVSGKEKATIEENEKLLKNFGFEFEEFGIDTYIVRSVPIIFDSPLDSGFFLEILDILLDKNIASIYDLKLDKIASISCKAAVKGNDKMDEEEAKAMISQMIDLENPFNCPHGRPTVVKMTKYEIEKMFKRIQN